MSFEQKIKKDIQIDKLNIKYHLNTSLEAEGISVSEDLIRRTMEAIRLQDAKGSDITKDIYRHTKPIFNRHARTLVTVVAAALILFAGYSALRLMSPLGMKGQSKSDKSILYDAADGGQTERFSTTARAPKEGSAVNKDDSVADMEEYKMAAPLDKDSVDEVAKSEEPSFNMVMGTEMTEDDAKKEANIEADDNMVALSQYVITAFSDIALIEATDVTEIKLSSQTTSDMDVISDKEQIEAFYSIMDKYSYLQSLEEDANIHYIVNIISEGKESLISIGDTTLIVDIIQDDTASHSIYTATDQNMLLNDLGELLGK